MVKKIWHQFTLPHRLATIQNSMEHCVYWIHTKDHTDIFTQGYVGITNNLERRSFRHFNYSDNQHLKNAINKYGKELKYLLNKLKYHHYYTLNITLCLYYFMMKLDLINPKFNKINYLTCNQIV